MRPSRLVLAIGALVLPVVSWSSGCDDAGGGGAGGDCDVTPAASECSSLCTTECARLVSCGSPSEDACVARCFAVYACPGETVGQDAAICSSRATSLEAADCTELCAWADSWQAQGGSPSCGAGGGGSGGAGGAG
ncbi:MAG: hypothetical protein IT373_26005 [Polyangiaceae bacterium]|nr:hypothetical protein [Polyangiaceae bacterium]